MTWHTAAFAWGFAEATLFFIVPDVLLGWIALCQGLRRGLAASVAATAGATLGGVLVYRNVEDIGDLVTRIPGIPPAMVDDAAARVRRGRWGAIVGGALGGIPYKVYALEAARQRLPLSGLVLVTPPARLWRFALVAAGAALVGARIRPSLRRRTTLWLGIYAIVWAVFYVGYFRVIARRFPQSPREGNDRPTAARRLDDV